MLIFLALNPLEVWNRHPPAIGQNIRNRVDSFLGQNGVGVLRNGPIGHFNNHFGLNFVGVFATNHVLQSRRHQNIDWQFQKLLISERPAVFNIANRTLAVTSSYAPPFFFALQSLLNIHSLLNIYSSFGIGERYHAVTCLLRQLGKVVANVSKSLNRHGNLAFGFVKLFPQFFKNNLHHRHPSAPSGLSSPKRPPQIQRFAGECGWSLVAAHFLILIQHPSHYLRIGINVWRWHIHVRANKRSQHPSIATR